MILRRISLYISKTGVRHRTAFKKEIPKQFSPTKAFSSTHEKLFIKNTFIFFVSIYIWLLLLTDCKGKFAH